MGAAVSDWRLARAVSRAGQLGVVSGTGLDTVMVRRLQRGDPGGAIRRALGRFPNAAIARTILAKYHVPGGKPDGVPLARLPMHALDAPRALHEVTVAANFVEVWLAKEGHDGLVGVNYLEKIQLPTLPSLYGALLAGVDYVLMGAGIPRAIPGLLDRLARHEPVTLKIAVQGAEAGEEHLASFDPAGILEPGPAPLRRPKFVAIVASEALALTLARKASGRVDGFVIEGPTAGGHNAPPRGPLQLTAEGEPLYGPKDEVDLAAFRALGVPFWLAGSHANRDKLREAVAQGAAGIQAGTVFAFCAESGLSDAVKRAVYARVRAGTASVFTDPVASPTGFPFKIVGLTGTMSEARDYEARPRVCDLGYLRHAYRKPGGKVGYRCPSEPVKTFIAKGGEEAVTRGRKCVCNGLLANVGLGQSQRDGYQERPLVTSGNDLARVGELLRLTGREPYSAVDVLADLLGDAAGEPEHERSAVLDTVAVTP